jgi:hypothetical protein
LFETFLFVTVVQGKHSRKTVTSNIDKVTNVDHAVLHTSGNKNTLGTSGTFV